MAEKKICPLSRIESYYGSDCLKEKCAWWIEEYVEGYQIEFKGCAITRLAGGSGELKKEEITAAKDRTG